MNQAPQIVIRPRGGYGLVEAVLTLPDGREVWGFSHRDPDLAAENARRKAIRLQAAREKYG